jgi:hypothetical protein
MPVALQKFVVKYIHYKDLMSYLWVHEKNDETVSCFQKSSFVTEMCIYSAKEERVIYEITIKIKTCNIFKG